VLLAMTISSPLEFIVLIGTIKVYGAGAAGQGLATFFFEGECRTYFVE
jgi:hypothetical protein